MAPQAPPRMVYVNFEQSISRPHDLIIEGWPLPDFRCPGDISNRTQLQTLLNAWKSGEAHWRRLTPEEIARRDANDLVVSQRLREAEEERRVEEERCRAEAEERCREEVQATPTSLGDGNENVTPDRDPSSSDLTASTSAMPRVNVPSPASFQSVMAVSGGQMVEMRTTTRKKRSKPGATPSNDPPPAKKKRTRGPPVLPPAENSRQSAMPTPSPPSTTPQSAGQPQTGPIPRPLNTPAPAAPHPANVAVPPLAAPSPAIPPLPNNTPLAAIAPHPPRVTPSPFVPPTHHSPILPPIYPPSGYHTMSPRPLGTPSTRPLSTSHGVDNLHTMRLPPIYPPPNQAPYFTVPPPAPFMSYPQIPGHNLPSAGLSGAFRGPQ